ncbi:MAG: hypothetical protein K6C36_04535 [Clostridia bacterium]|nr:hypothetical protein [Clostridia bacterium]
MPVLRERTAGFFTRHRYAVFFFAYLVVYNVCIVNRCGTWTVSDIVYTYHIVDFKNLGFRSQLLPGAIFYGIFGDRTSETLITVYEAVLIILFFIFAAFLLERFMHSVEKKYLRASMILVLFYMSGMLTFAIFTDELGMLDSYWLFFSAMFIFFLDRKALRFLIPVLFVLSLLVHFSAVLCYVAGFSILLLYRISAAEDRRSRAGYIAVAALCLAATGVLLIYFILFQSDGLPMTMEEFGQLVKDRGGDYVLYYEYSLFNWYKMREVIPSEVFAIASPVERLIKIVISKCSFTIWEYSLDPLAFALRLALIFSVGTPAAVFYYRRMARFFKVLRGRRLKRLCVVLMMIQPVFTAVTGSLYSPDLVRWCTHAFLIAFTLFLYLLRREPELAADVFGSLERASSSVPFFVYFLSYALVNLWAYC